MPNKWDDFAKDLRRSRAGVRELAGGGPRAAKERLTVKTEHFSFECLFVPARVGGPGPRKLVVSLPSGGRGGAKTPEDAKIVFLRWSWHAVFPDRDLLCVEDPMYKLHPALLTAWCYGEKDVSGIAELCEVADAVRTAQGIARRDVLFLGSSAGGYLALFLCDLMKGSSCLAMNPQVFPPNWSSFFLVAEALGLDPNAPDPLGRDDLTRVSRNRESRFLVSCAVTSKDDFDRQVKPLFDSLGGADYGDVAEIPPVAIRDNFVFLFARGKYPVPHLLLFNRAESAILARFLDDKDAGPEDYAWLLESCEERWHAEQELNCRLFWLGILGPARLADCKFPVLGWRHCEIESDDGEFAVRIQIVQANTRVRQPVNFYVTSKGAAAPRELAALIGGLPETGKRCKVTARAGDVRAEAPGLADLVPCLNELLWLFTLPRGPARSG